MLFYLNNIKSYLTALLFTIPIPPLLLPTGAYLIGVAWSALFGFNTLFVIVILVMTILLILSTYRQAIVIILVPMLLGFSLFYHQQQTFNIFNNAWDNRHIDIRATVQDITYTQDTHHPYIVTLSCADIKEHGNDIWQNTNYTFFIYCRSKPSFEVADYVKVAQLHYKKPQGSYALYLLKEGVASSLFIQQIKSVILYRPSYSLLRQAHRYRNTMMQHFKQNMASKTFALFAAIFYGNKMLVKKDLDARKTEFQVWGISHYLARSGLHMVIITMLLIALMSLLPLHITYKRSFIIIISMLYHLLSWPSISFLRAFYTIILYYFCNLLSLPIYALHLFCIVCLLILLLNPAQSLFLDFQLSFGLTGALAWFNQITAQRRLFAQNY